jgi:RNA 2',3'-cyclic 3'-phosphodiesterase
MRCFVAAWPDDATRESLDRLLLELRPRVPAARPMQPRNLHLTLAFIGELDASTAATVTQADTQQTKLFDWSVDCLGWFPRARVAWAGGPLNARMNDAVSNARGNLERLGVPFDHKRFVPHVTLFRDVRRFDCSGPLSPPLEWRTAHVALYAAERDERGPVYRRVSGASPCLG